MLGSEYEDAYFSAVSCGAVGNFAAKSCANTRGLSEHCAAFCTARLAPDFHQNHTTPPLAVLVGDPFFA
jgi:hypothetical protein